MAHVRHGEGFRLAGRSGRHPLYDEGGAARRHRAGELRHAVLADEGGQDLSARVRRPVAELRQGRTGAQVLRGRRSDGAQPPAHALRPIVALRLPLLHRVFRARSTHGGRRM